jgi:hypothetical protein
VWVHHWAEEWRICAVEKGNGAKRPQRAGGSEERVRFRGVRAHSRLAAFLASAIASAAIGAAFSPSTFVAVKDAVAGSSTEKSPPRPNVLPSQLVSSDRIGLFKVEESGRAEDAFLAYGDPSSRKQEDKISCRMSWDQFGLEILFYNLGANDPCFEGRFCSATITGRQWATSRGLQVGESVRRLWELYPKAKQLRRPGALVYYGLEPGTYPCGLDSEGGLEAVTAGGRIGSFTVTFAAGGD